MYLGRHKTGSWISLQIQCYDGLGSPRFVIKNPDAAPTATIYKFNKAHTDPDSPITSVHAPSDISMARISSYRLAPKDRGGLKGWFERLLFLDTNFRDLVIYVVQYSYDIGDFAGAGVDYFEIIPDGHQKGAYTALTEYERPHATFVVGQLDSDELEVSRKNPRL
jgi:hypothetical protein